MLSVERMRMLLAVSRHGSVGRAAAALHVTGAAASQQLAKLEREVGQPLLARNGRGVRLTDAGLLLARHAEQILSSIAEAESDLAARLGEVAGELVIAGFATAARGLLPEVLTTLRHRFPKLRPLLRETEPSGVLPLLRRGDVDLAVVLDWDNKPMAVPPDMRTRWLWDDPADLAVPDDHRLAGRDRVDVCELADEDWIAWPPGEMCQSWLLFTLRAGGVEPFIAHTAAEHQTQLALVAAGLGVAVVPRLGRDPVPPGVSFASVNRPLVRHVHVMWRTDSHRHPSIQAALTVLTEAATRIAPDPGTTTG